MACSVANPLGCVSSAAKSVAGDAFAAIARDFAKAADSTINWLWTQMSLATAVHLGGHGFDLDLGIMIAITGVVAVGLFTIQVMASVLRRDPSGLGRALKGLVVAFIAGGVAITVTNLTLSAVDALSAGVVRLAMGTTIQQMGHRVLATDAITQVGNPAGMFLLSIAAIVAAVIVWAALLVRKALIVVSAIFAPLAFAGSLADITVSWTRRWIEIMAALIMSKLVLVMIFVVGWGILDVHVGQTVAGGHTQHITQTATGLLVLAMAGFAPWMALKLVHFSGEQFHHLHLMAGHTTSGAGRAAAVPEKAAAWRTAAYRLGPNGRAFPGGGQRGAGGPAATQQAAAGGAGARTGGGGGGGGGTSGGGGGPSGGGNPGQRAAPAGPGGRSNGSNGSSGLNGADGANGSNGSRPTAPLPQPPPPSLS